MTTLPSATVVWEICSSVILSKCMVGLELSSVAMAAGSSAHTPAANDSNAPTDSRNRPTLLIKAGGKLTHRASRQQDESPIVVLKNGWPVFLMVIRAWRPSPPSGRLVGRRAFGDRLRLFPRRKSTSRPI